MNPVLLKKYCKSSLDYLKFCGRMIDVIYHKMEDEMAFLLNEIITLDKKNRDNMNLSNAFFDETHFSDEETKMVLKLSKQLNDYFSEKKESDHQNLSKEKFIIENYKNDIFLVFNHLKDHIKETDEVLNDLISNFQFIDRTRQQMDHINFIMKQLVRDFEETDLDNEEKFIEMIDRKEKTLEELQAIISTAEEREIFKEIFNIQVKEVNEDEIFEMF